MSIRRVSSLPSFRAFRAALAACVWAAVAAVGCGPLQAATLAGTMPGSFSVNPNGAAAYNVPIAVSPGVATPLLWANNKVQDRDDNCLHISYYRGAATKMTQRLQASVSLPTQLEDAALSSSPGVSGTLVNSYNIAYGPSPSGAGADYRSRVASIHACSASDCVAPTQFGWRSDGSARFATSTPAMPYTEGGKFGRWNRFVDANGDGLPDVFPVTDTAVGSVRVLLARRDANGSFAAPIDVPHIVPYASQGFRYDNQLMDLNGGGYADLNNTDQAMPQRNLGIAQA